MAAPKACGDGDGVKAQLPTVPGYEILRELGRGGMGIVYQARHTALKRLVALKMILSGHYASPEQLDRFQREAEALARL
jgi:serine/threonine protein kinase